MGCRSRTGPFASSSTRNDRRTAPMACGRKKPGRPTACSMRSAVQDRIIGLDIQPSLRCVARSGVQPLPAAALDWWRRNGRTIDPCGVSPAGPANSGHDSPADRRSRPAPPRSRPFPCERAAPCNRPEVSGISAIPAATGFRSMYAPIARRASSSSIATLLNRPSKNAPLAITEKPPTAIPKICASSSPGSRSSRAHPATTLQRAPNISGASDRHRVISWVIAYYQSQYARQDRIAGPFGIPIEAGRIRLGREKQTL